MSSEEFNNPKRMIQDASLPAEERDKALKTLWDQFRASDDDWETLSDAFRDTC